MSDERLLATLIGMFSLKSRSASSTADVWRAMQSVQHINILWESLCKVNC